jgi:hypothetical protein
MTDLDFAVLANRDYTFVYNLTYQSGGDDDRHRAAGRRVRLNPSVDRLRRVHRWRREH